MTKRMGDAIDPHQLPGGLDAYAGYGDGRWPDYLAIAAAHPTAYLLELTVYLANLGQGIDMEPMDATVDQFPAYYRARVQGGVWRPVGYASISAMPGVIHAASVAGIPRSAYRLWSAHYGAGQHICGPTTCGGAACDGTQWIDHGGWDESLLHDDFFGPIPPPPVHPEGKMLTNCVGLAETYTGLGYWLVQADGGIFTHGDAQAHYLGGPNQIKPGLTKPIVGIASHPTDWGYWCVAADGGVFTFGVAKFYGSLGATHLNQPIIGIIRSASGLGYGLVASDGGVFTFGDFIFEGAGA